MASRSLFCFFCLAFLVFFFFLDQGDAREIVRGTPDSPKMKIVVIVLVGAITHSRNTDTNTQASWCQPSSIFFSDRNAATTCMHRSSSVGPRTVIWFSMSLRRIPGLVGTPAFYIPPDLGSLVLLLLSINLHLTTRTVV